MAELVDQSSTKFRKIVYLVIIVAFVLFFEYEFARGVAHGSFLIPFVLGGLFLWAWWNCERQWADSVVDVGESLDIRRGSVVQRLPLSQIEIGKDRVIYTRGRSADLVTLRFPGGSLFGDSISFMPKNAATILLARLSQRRRQAQNLSTTDESICEK